MRILLTGSKGNLGSHIIKYNTHDIVCLDRDNWNELPEVLASKIDVVIHLAYDLKNNLNTAPVSIMDSNLMSTTKILEYMNEYKIPRLLFLSSAAVYGESMNTNEETECEPISINGVVKLLNEKIIETYCSKNNIKFEIFRVFNMFGGDDHFSVLYHLKKAIENNCEFNLNNKGISQRDFIHVEDVARIILKLINTDHRFKYLNIGTGASTSISSIVNLVRDKHTLKIKNTFTPEAEYSRADNTKLSSIIEYDYINVLDFVEKKFLGD